MKPEDLLFLTLVFLIWSSIAAVIVSMFMPDNLRRRMASLQVDAQPGLQTKDNPWVERIIKISRPFAKLSLPSEGWGNSPVRIRFINAGWRERSAPYLFFGTKTLLAIATPLAAMLYCGDSLFSGGTPMVMLVLALGVLTGYYLPNLLLNHRIEKRKLEIFENFPDALDLLTICVEAGLGLDAALSRVADEIHIKSAMLAQELQLVLMELRAGFTKERALRNLALRSGVEDIDLLVAMLIQSDRFGTSMGDSLRIHAENLRTKRQQRAEEAAAKISLKLLFPLILMIFPTLMLILVGPAALQIYRALLPTVSG